MLLPKQLQTDDFLRTEAHIETQKHVKNEMLALILWILCEREQKGDFFCHDHLHIYHGGHIILK